MPSAMRDGLLKNGDRLRQDPECPRQKLLGEGAIPLFQRAAVSYASICCFCLLLAPCLAAEPPAAPRKLLLAFVSMRERPYFGTIFFYEHDGVAQGRIVGSVPPSIDTGDYHPSLTADGAICAHASRTGEGNSWQIHLWDLKAKKRLELPIVNDALVDQKDPTLSADGALLSFGAWKRPGGAGGWDAFLFDTVSRKLLPVSQVNTHEDEQELTLSGNGRYLAFVSQRADGEGLADISLYDRVADTLLPLPGLNSPQRELNPALSADGRLVCFVSDRRGGRGGKDVYLYDREKRALAPLPELNSVAHDQTPTLSPDGRWIAFVSERTSGTGERDVYLYDRQTSKLVATPGLNSKFEDFEPHLAQIGNN